MASDTVFNINPKVTLQELHDALGNRLYQIQSMATIGVFAAKEEPAAGFWGVVDDLAGQAEEIPEELHRKAKAISSSEVA